MLIAQQIVVLLSKGAGCVQGQAAVLQCMKTSPSQNRGLLSVILEVKIVRHVVASFYTGLLSLSRLPFITVFARSCTDEIPAAVSISTYLKSRSCRRVKEVFKLQLNKV